MSEIARRAAEYVVGFAGGPNVETAERRIDQAIAEATAEQTQTIANQRNEITRLLKEADRARDDAAFLTKDALELRAKLAGVRDKLEWYSTVPYDAAVRCTAAECLKLIDQSVG